MSKFHHTHTQLLHRYKNIKCVRVSLDESYNRQYSKQRISKRKETEKKQKINKNEEQQKKAEKKRNQTYS